MSNYNEIWTKEKFLEYRKLKRSGYSHDMLKEHFGDDIYYSGLYSKYDSKLAYLKMFNEIKINPIQMPYKYWKLNSFFYIDKYDHFAEFETSNGNIYVLCLMFFKIDDIETYNITFTTKSNFDRYYSELNKILLNNKKISKDDFAYLKSIFEKETNINEIYDIMKRLSWILLDIYNRHLNNDTLSIGETDNYKKIMFYRNIIKDSFENITEKEILLDDKYRYYIYFLTKNK